MPKARIFYFSLPDEMRKQEKLGWFRENKLEKIPFTHILPDEKHNWINLSDNDFDTLLPLIDKEAKAGKIERAIFKLFSNGVKSQRDEWVYDFSKNDLTNRMQYFVEVYQKTLENPEFADRNKIKWDRELTGYLERKVIKNFEEKKIVRGAYRPYTKMWFYFDRHFNGMTYQWFDIYNESQQKVIVIPGLASPKDFHTLAIDKIIDLNALPAGCQCLPLYRYDATGARHDNITDWGLQQFRSHYAPKVVEVSSPVCFEDNSEVSYGYKSRQIEKEDIFHYTYAVLHDPAYRSKYELNLKREFPRLPFYEDFWQWAAWGKALMDLHIGYESAEPYPLKRTDMPLAAARARSAASKEAFMQLSMIMENLQASKPGDSSLLVKPKVRLRAKKEEGIIEIDEVTTLSGIPKKAWDYKLGNRSALEWVLDQYKEKKPSDPTIAEKFNTYRFADYKEEVIELLKKVCTVSVRTMEIIQLMKLKKKE